MWGACAACSLGCSPPHHVEAAIKEASHHSVIEGVVLPAEAHRDPPRSPRPCNLPNCSRWQVKPTGSQGWLSGELGGGGVLGGCDEHRGLRATRRGGCPTNSLLSSREEHKETRKLAWDRSAHSPRRARRGEPWSWVKWGLSRRGAGAPVWLVPPAPGQTQRQPPSLCLGGPSP